jgi:hypothetical protein
VDKHQRKALLRAREEAAQRAAEESRERRVGEDVHWRGVGLLLLQVSESPSFEPGHLWDVRELEDTFKVYVSQTNPDKPGYLLPGYTELAFEQAPFRDLIGQLERAQVGMPLSFQGKSGCDGTGYSLTRRVGFDSVSFSWWEDGPPEWRPLTGPALALIQYFKGLKPAQR